MKKLLLSSAAFVAFGATSFAADLPAPMAMVEPMPVAAPYSWTGFYLGAQVGAGFGHDNASCFDGEAELFDATLADGAGDDEIGTTDVECSDFDDLTLPGGAPAGTAFLESESDDDDVGILAGLHIGADYQMGNFVIGALLEGNWIDSDGTEISGSFDEDLYEFAGPPFNGVLPGGSIGTVGGVQVIEDNDLTFPDATNAEEEPVDPRTDYSFDSGGIDWYGTLRARAGFAMGRALIYGTGGLAFGETGESSYDITEFYTGRETASSTAFGAGLPTNCTAAPVVGTTSPGAICTYSDSDGGGTSWGWALGAGIDVLATNNFSIGLEYLFVNLDDSDDLTFTSLSGDSIEFEGADNDFHTVTLRASYRFGGGS